ncbi:hypothetical protein FGM00_14215 [Aggregatimonas sangjinii]|uniref:Uncharacterized protein n=1 Tax=Aggregatimonas sangjinii TaxID=2583587 RepID=A0A5B7SV98_9FLAO|nr:hypothetical protein [Aggregatimonas sangjinii]QCX01209.1 hypothetical protein FGM00_14215 [Aggregatimonas sangjinii]
MKAILILLFLMITRQSYTQNRVILMTNNKTQKERVVKERKRIRVTKISGEKFQGRFAIVDENTIALDGVEISLSEIEKIRRHPLFNSIFINTNLVHIGTLGLFFGFLATSVGSATTEDGNLNIIPLISGGVIFAAGLYGAIKGPNLNKGYNINKKWRFEIDISSQEIQKSPTKE